MQSSRIVKEFLLVFVLQVSNLEASTKQEALTAFAKFVNSINTTIGPTVYQAQAYVKSRDPVVPYDMIERNIFGKQEFLKQTIISMTGGDLTHCGSTGIREATKFGTSLREILYKCIRPYQDFVASWCDLVTNEAEDYRDSLMAVTQRNVELCSFTSTPQACYSQVIGIMHTLDEQASQTFHMFGEVIHGLRFGALPEPEPCQPLLERQISLIPERILENVERCIAITKMFN